MREMWIVIASVAKQSNLAEPRAAKLDCFAPLAMTGVMQIYGVLLQMSWTQ